MVDIIKRTEGRRRGMRKEVASGSDSIGGREKKKEEKKGEKRRSLHSTVSNGGGAGGKGLKRGEKRGETAPPRGGGEGEKKNEGGKVTELVSR